MADVTMPQLGETVTEGTITRWFKNVGDQVAEDEVLFEVSTDKVDSEVPSPAAGYLTEIKVAEGDTVDVGVVLAVISDAPGAGGNGSAPAAEAPPAPAPAPEPEPAPAPPPAPAPAAAAPPPAAPAPAPAPVAAAPADEAPAATPPPAAAPPAPAPTNGALNKPLSPVVRRLIAEHGLNPDAITGTGANGRITRNDVLAVIDAGGATAPAAAPPAPAAAPAPAAPAPAPTTAAPAPAPAAAPPAAAPAPIVRSGERDTAIPHSNIRRRTAEHMTRSLATSAHVYAAVEVDFEGVEVVRRAQQEAFKASEGIGLNYLPFIGRAVIDAIYEFPQVNASFGENELVVHNYVNLGIAVDLDFQGLMVPVIQDADGKRLRLIAREIADLARKARSKKLSPDDIVGGTFTITNPGPFGTLITLPIINQPQVAILSTDGISRKPVVVDLPDGGEAIAIHSVGTLALTWDHRAFDGAYAAAFLRRIKELIQTRDWSAELLKLPLTKAVHPAG